MGNRATVQVVNSNTGEVSPVAYMHWLGAGVLDVIRQAAPKMRKGDLNYATARLFGHLHNAAGGDDEGLSFGVYNASSAQRADTCGDAGHYSVDLHTGTVTNYPAKYGQGVAVPAAVVATDLPLGEF